MIIDNSVALITGGASGLGLATARAILENGGMAVLVDLPSRGGEDVALRLGENARFVAADVRNSDEVQRAIDVATSLGQLRIVVNCAGIGDPARTVGRDGPVDLQRFTRVIEVNLVGTFNVIRLAAAAMYANDDVEGERGVIVNTASVAAFDGQIGQASYSASKAAIVGMTLPLAREFASHTIRVMTIAPGIFDTPILQGLSDENRASLGAQTPHPARLGRPDEFAALVVHIAQNAMLNGEVVRLDGSIRMAAQ